MKNFPFFDVACQVGKTCWGPGLNIPTGITVPELLQEMDRFGIDKALVRDTHLATLGAVASNRDLVAMLKEGDPDHRLYGVWCLLPEQCEELPPPDKFFDEMEKNNIRALTLQPAAHRWNPCRFTIKNYMAQALERRIPVLLDGFKLDWIQIQSFLTEFPDNIFISVENSGKWGMDRRIRPMMDAFKNLYFSIDGYWVPGGIPALVRRYGAERILFGSRSQTYLAGCAMLQLKNAGLSEEETRMIASGNLEKLLKGVSK